MGPLLFVGCPPMGPHLLWAKRSATAIATTHASASEQQHAASLRPAASRRLLLPVSRAARRQTLSYCHRANSGLCFGAAARSFASACCITQTVAPSQQGDAPANAQLLCYGVQLSLHAMLCRCRRRAHECARIAVRALLSSNAFRVAVADPVLISAAAPLQTTRAGATLLRAI